MLYVVQLNKLYSVSRGFLLSKIWQTLNLILDARWSCANLYPDLCSCITKMCP